MVNLLVAIALFFGLIFLFLSLLDIITRHNKYEEVPNVAGKTLAEAYSILEEKGFVVEIQDSIWDPKIAPNQVLKQAPEGGQLVKSHRSIFLSVNRAQPPLVDMPNLVGFSFRNALLYLEQLGLELGDTTRKPDIARDAVLEQRYNGRSVAGGARIFAGSRIDLVLGSGLGNNEYTVPDLVGLTYAEARELLSSMGINFGAVLPDPDVKDLENAFVYRQNPNVTSPLPEGGKQTNRIREGQSMDVWLSLIRREKLELTDADLDE